jgi:hypothetical protein
MSGRTFRTVVGAIVILTDVAVFAVEKIVHNEPYTMTGLATHGAFLILGLMLFDPKHGAELVKIVSAKLPFGKAK